MFDAKNLRGSADLFSHLNEVSFAKYRNKYEVSPSTESKRVRRAGKMGMIE